jgi:hypothetical protein
VSSGRQLRRGLKQTNQRRPGPAKGPPNERARKHTNKQGGGANEQTHTHTHTLKETNKHANKQTNGRTNETNKEANKETKKNKQPDEPTNKAKGQTTRANGRTTRHRPAGRKAWPGPVSGRVRVGAPIRARSVARMPSHRRVREGAFT